MKDKVVFTFGRMNPPTIGHEKLVSKVKAEAGKRGAEAHIYLSHSRDKNKNPLDYNTKIRLAQSAFGPAVKRSGHKTVIDILKMLSKRGVKEIVMIVGSDRVTEFDRILTRYNGKEWKFDSIRVISAGERDPDADNVSGMSASKLRALAGSGDYRNFAFGMPSGLSNAEIKKAYNAIRSVSEEITTGELLHNVLMKPKMKRFVRYYLNWRRKHPGQGRAGVVKAAAILGLQPRDANEMIASLNKMVSKGKLPKHLAIPEGYSMNENTLTEAKYEVNIEGLPKIYMDAGSEGSVKVTLRKLLKKPDAIRSVTRVSPAEVKKAFIRKALGTEEELPEEKRMANPCWKGYKAYGVKKKNGKTVPNCVPEETFSENELDMFVATLNMSELDIESFPEELAEVLTPVQRIKRARIMRRMAPKIKRKREMLKKRMASPEKLNVRSRKAAIKLLRKRFAGKLGSNYANLSPSQKVTVDKLVSKKLTSVGTLSKRLLPKIRKAEMERLKKARSAKKEEYESNMQTFIEDLKSEGKSMDQTLLKIRKEREIDKRKWDLMKDRARTRDTKKQNAVTTEKTLYGENPGKDTARRKIQELSKSTLSRYAAKANKDIDKKFAANPNTERSKQKLANRVRGYARATIKMQSKNESISFQNFLQNFSAENSQENPHNYCGTPECCGTCETAGAGEEGTKKAVKKYKSDTPGE